MSKYLVTGGAGFIGSNLVDELIKSGHKVRVLDNLCTGHRRNLNPKAEFMKGDIRKPADVKKVVKGMDGVFHLAASRAVAQSVDDPIGTDQINVGGTLNLLTACRDAKVKRFVFTSSCAMYGENKSPVIRETELPDPCSPYAATKIMGEYYCNIFSRLYGLETVSLRYFNVFGPRQNPESMYGAVIPIFIERLLKGQAPEIHWDGKQSRDFCHVANVVQANVLAMKTPKANGEVFNIGCHEEHTILDLYKELQSYLGRTDIKPVFKPKRAGDIRKSLADITKAKRILKYKVKTPFKKGLRETVQWFLDNDVVGQVERARRKKRSKK